jgi:hypothetical protein
MRSKIATSILQSARVAELKRATLLVTPSRAVPLPREPTQRIARLVALVRAERRKNAALIEQLR